MSRKRSRVAGDENVVVDAAIAKGGASALHLSSLDRLLSPATRELAEFAFTSLDENGDGTLTVDDFLLRARITQEAGAGDASATEQVLWLRIVALFDSYDHDQQISPGEFLAGLLIIALSRPLPPATLIACQDFSSVLALLSHEVNLAAFETIVSLLVEARLPLTDDKIAEFQRVRNTEGRATPATLCRSLFLWLSARETKTIERTYRTLDANGDGVVTCVDFQQNQQIFWQKMVSFFDNFDQNQVITLDEFEQGLLSLVLAGGPPALDRVPATLCDLCGLCMQHVQERVTAEADLVLIESGQLAAMDLDMILIGLQMLDPSTNAYIHSAYAALDANGDNVLSREDFTSFSGGRLFQKMIAIFDSGAGATPDGRITYDEFRAGFVGLALRDDAESVGEHRTVGGSLALIRTRINTIVMKQIEELLREAGKLS